MLESLWLVPTLPLAGFLALTFTGSRVPKGVSAVIGAGSVGVAALLATAIGAVFILGPQTNGAFTQTLWTWMAVGGFAPRITLHLDRLSLIMMMVVLWVGFLIHLYSTEFMREEEGYARFFAYTNLFVSSMLILVLAGDLLFLYLGWEGVGLCSYLLIGFWYRDPANGKAARKAFIVTRVGDTAMAIGLFLLFTHLGTLDIQELMARASSQWPVGAPLATLAAALLLGGAVGKSAQLPLQTWLPDAMAGPTPVSALIHSATMVTAGVYLIARTHVLFTLAPAVEHAVAVIGALTLLLSGFSALVQRDIKRVLAYSTISQIGYMFLALGVGAFGAAIFHFMTHAFFKALLFLGAGVIIHGLHHEHDIFRMGGLRRQIPVTFWTFLIGSCSLAALPLVTAGFYSKDLIISEAWASPEGSPWLWAAGVAGAFLTSLYTFRMVFIAFFGEAKQQMTKKPGLPMTLPLLCLAFLSIVGGLINAPRITHGLLPEAVASGGGLGLELITAAVSLSGIGLAYLLFFRQPAFVHNWPETALGAALHRFWFSGWAFDWLYDLILIRPFVWLARINQADVVDVFFNDLARTTQSLSGAVALTQSGKVRWYAMGIALGAAVMLGLAMVIL